jgi:hypothetical protein
MYSLGGNSDSKLVLLTQMNLENFQLYISLSANGNF